MPAGDVPRRQQLRRQRPAVGGAGDGRLPARALPGATSAALRAGRRHAAALGTALAQAGRPNEAAQTFTLAARDADDAFRLELHRRSAEELLRGGYLEEGLHEIRNVLATIGLRLAPTPFRALIAVLTESKMDALETALLFALGMDRWLRRG